MYHDTVGRRTFGEDDVKPNHRVLAFCLALAFGLFAPPELATAQQQPTKVKISRLSFPSLSTLMIDIINTKGIDKKHGIDLEGVSFSAVSSYVAALASGETEITATGPHVVQKMILEGVPIRIGLTWARLNVMSVIAADATIKSIADLKGKSIAADMGSAEYQILAISGRKQGIVFGKDVTVVQAGPPLARTQLQAQRVEAAMMWETTTTMTLRDNPNYRVILSGDAAWKAISDTPGFDLVVAMREDFLKSKPEALPRLARMFQEGQDFIKNNLDEADAIVANSVKLPPGVFKEAVTSGRLLYDIVIADTQRAALTEMFRAAVDSGYIPKMPPEHAIHKQN
jgi:ABC-type nitrate/sulfonate/bicarbonate transport system substrate-binding protein